MELSPEQIVYLRRKSEKQKQQGSRFLKNYGHNTVNIMGDLSSIASKVKGVLSFMSGPSYYNLNNLR